MTDHQTLPPSRDGIQRRQAAQLQLDLFPLGQRIDKETAVRASEFTVAIKRPLERSTMRSR